jgi:hypothetical protein
MISEITHCKKKDERKNDSRNPKYSNTKNHYKLYYIEDLLYLDYQS